MTPHLKDEHERSVEQRLATLEREVLLLRARLAAQPAPIPVYPSWPTYPGDVVTLPYMPTYPGDVVTLPYMPTYPGDVVTLPYMPTVVEPAYTPLRTDGPGTHMPSPPQLTPFYYPPVMPSTAPVDPYTPWLTPIATCAASSANAAE